ncbi:uncharacterized protein EV420DRAFT_606008 [Desarmillaria tabescens]|uniref:Uncharacterized protein n=1 Tax=Armillaria tabescens TaxID=1929756 RepID=A0AA39K8L2_ARMTA|nr:uncharacterized protein EV420DRAFT_606008 [Desarmillaria tabescens]KAK0454228.1 hypothetical protein EV420DRAFT_606008 [Desarmillaria tabescens]
MERMIEAIRNLIQMAAPSISVQIAEYAYPSNTTGKIYSLPQELINAIIDEIHSDPDPKTARRTLKSCGLISRIFLRRTREHLFRHITIRSIPECQELLALSQVHSFTTSLTIIFQSRRPHVRGYEMISTLTELPSLIDALHNLNTIKLCGMDWKSVSQRFIDSLASSSFMSITLMHTHFPDSNAFYSFLSHSPNLRQLSCFKTTIDSSDRPPFRANFDVSHRPRITELSLREMNQITAMLSTPALSPVNLSGLRVLDVFLEEVGQFDQAHRLMNLTAHSLEVLRVSQLLTRPADRSQYFPIDRLKSIMIETCDSCLVVFNWWIEHFEKYPAMQCSSMHLFVCVLTNPVRTLADYAGWKRLDIALSRTSIRSLQVVVTLVATSNTILASEHSAMKSAVEENLPILMSRGIVRVHVDFYKKHNSCRRKFPSRLRDDVERYLASE